MPKTDILVNGFVSKDNKELRLCRKDKIPAGYKPVSKKASKGLIGLSVNDTPGEDIFTSGNSVLCTKAVVKKSPKGDK